MILAKFWRKISLSEVTNLVIVNWFIAEFYLTYSSMHVVCLQFFFLVFFKWFDFLLSIFHICIPWYCYFYFYTDESLATVLGHVAKYLQERLSDKNTEINAVRLLSWITKALVLRGHFLMSYWLDKVCIVNVLILL